jgi:hypothetical protein
VTAGLQPSPAGHRSRRGLAPPLTATAAGAAVTAFAAAVAGARAALSAGLGLLVVLVFFAAGALPLLVVRGQERRAALGTAVLLLTYTLRLALAVAVLRLAGRADVVLPRWTGLTVVGCALAWVVAQAVVSLLPARTSGVAGTGPG